jgi:signal transduction histidine kinase
VTRIEFACQLNTASSWSGKKLAKLKRPGTNRPHTKRARTNVVLKNARTRMRPGIVDRDVSSLANFLSPLSFRLPEKVVPSAWYEHAPFAFWLIEQLRPNFLVELGTHYGFSFFTFCQAIRMTGLSTAAYAVDLWTGDEHAGFYGEEVYEGVQVYTSERYSDIASLMKMAFADALPYFENGSIDLLHIDGRHYFEDVSADFKSWLPKLSNRSVVLFHDTSVREREFGVHRLWSTLCEKYPHFSFIHGYGLGVLGVGKTFPPAISNLFEASADAVLTASIRNAYARLGGATVKSAAEEVFRERDRLVSAVQEKVAAAERSSVQTAALTADLEAASAAAREREAAIAESERKLAGVVEQLAAFAMAAEERQRERDKLAADLHNTRSTSIEYMSEIEKLSRKLASEQNRDQDVQRLSHELAAARGFLRDSQSEVQRLCGDLDAAKANSARLDAERHRASEELQGVLAQLHRLEQAMSHVTRNKDPADIDWAARVQNLETRLQVTKEERDGVAASEDKAQAQVRALHLTLVDAEAAIAKSNRDKQTGLRLLRRLKLRQAVRRLMSSGLFDAEWYKQEYPASAESGYSPAEHYLEEGYASGHRPNPLFDTRWYLERYEDVRRAGVNPVLHYLEYGFREGRDPGPGFQTDFYLAANPDVRSSGANPLAHYLQHGRHEGRLPVRPA